MTSSGQLAEIERLESELEDFLDHPSVSELKTENEKLAYQINTLRRAVNEEVNCLPTQGYFFILYFKYNICDSFFSDILALN